MTNTAFGTFFLPGPTEVRPEVLAAMSKPMISHRGAEFERIFERVQGGLQAVFATRRPILIGTCSATGFMEAGMRSAPPGRLLALVNGAFSERFAHIAETCGRAVDRYIVSDGDVHDPDEVKRRLGAGAYSTVAVVHSETSTGALNDVAALARAAREHGATCLVDSVTGVGGADVRFDEWQLDYALTGSQKALALPPGLAFAVASDGFMAQIGDPAARSGGVYFDLREFESFARKHQVPNTPATSLFYALDTQLAAVAAEGMEQRLTRHAAMARRTAEWVDQMLQNSGIDISVMAGAGHRSPTVTTIVLPRSITSDVVVRAVAERGYTIGAGYGKLKSSTIRIGHMGDHTPDGLDGCLAVCGDALHSATRTTILPN